MLNPTDADILALCAAVEHAAGFGLLCARGGGDELQAVRDLAGAVRGMLAENGRLRALFAEAALAAEPKAVETVLGEEVRRLRAELAQARKNQADLRLQQSIAVITRQEACAAACDEIYRRHGEAVRACDTHEGHERLKNRAGGAGECAAAIRALPVPTAADFATLSGTDPRVLDYLRTSKVHPPGPEGWPPEFLDQGSIDP